ncbi:hypothetical protein VL2_gp024 [Pseudomonas phage vB_PaeM_VL12]|nr:hypothetical protein VL2_gp024 [Pseudomonas phage vB_PaeM_VL12]
MKGVHEKLSVDVWGKVVAYVSNLRKSSPLLEELVVLDHPGFNPQERRTLNSRRKAYHHLVALFKDLRQGVTSAKAKRLHRIASMLSK